MHSNTSLEQNRQVKPPKKVWQKPDFQILDTDNIHTGTHHNVHEASFNPGGGVPIAMPHYTAWTTRGRVPKAHYYS
jgi:hypothetical protein